MMLSILRLELVKQRRIFLSTLFVLMIGVGGSALFVPWIRPIGRWDAFCGAATFMVFLLPLVVAFHGASAAWPLRKAAERNMEEPLPVHPVVKVFGAYTAGLIYSMVISLMVLSLLGVREVFQLFDLRFGPFALPVPWLLAYCFSLNLLSFVLTYLLGLAVLGAGVALAACFIDSFLRTVIFIIQQTPFYFELAKNIPLPWIWSHLTFLLSVLLWLLCIVLGARSLERGGGIKPGNGIVLGCLLLIGPLLTACVLRWNISQVEMYSQEPFWPSFWQYAANTLL